MSDSITEIKFPSRAEILALIYVQNQDLSGKTPTEINEMFHKAYNEIRRDSKNRRDELNSL